MTDRPILFSAPMVRALLAGTKTQTRRAVKLSDRLCRFDEDGYSAVTDDTIIKVSWTSQSIMKLVKCPYGQPGDRLWVREAWTTHAFLDSTSPRDLKTRSIHYQADGQIKTGKTRPSIHMPRWASRITLEVTGVRVERLQDISEADALAEGITSVTFRPDSGWPLCEGYMVGPDDGKTALETSAAKAYRQLWESINGAGSWDAKPWVWVVEFRRIKP